MCVLCGMEDQDSPNTTPVTDEKIDSYIVARLCDAVKREWGPLPADCELAIEMDNLKIHPSIQQLYEWAFWAKVLRPKTVAA
jgi:hypothetical protein